MALDGAILRIVKLDKNGVSSTFADLLTGWINLVRWDRVSSKDGGEEAIQIALNAGTNRQAIIETGKFDVMFKAAELYDGAHAEYSYWLETKSDGSGVIYRALITGGNQTQRQTDTTNSLQTRERGQSHIGLKIQRGAWENSEAQPTITTHVNETDRQIFIDQGGSLAGRINRLQIYATVAHPSKTMWIGIKPVRGDYLATDFVNTWLATHGTWQNGQAAESRTKWGASYPYITLPMNSGSGLIYRGSIRLDDVYGGSNEQHFRGDFRGLVRIKGVGNDLHARIVVKAGVNKGSSVTIGTLFIKGGGAYETIELDRVFKLPNLANRPDTGWISFGQFGFHFFIEDLTNKFSADEQIHLRYIKPMPAEHFVRITSERGTITYPNRVELVTHPNGRINAVVTNTAGQMIDFAEVEPHNWNQPIEGGWLVAAHNVESNDGFLGQLVLQVDHRHRYSYRT